MAMDFRRFLQEMVGGNTPQVPAFQQQQAPPPIPPQNTPIVGPMPAEELVSLQHPGVWPIPARPAPGPIVAPQPPPQAMSPAQFAAQQGPVVGPTPPPAEPDMTGTWVTVQYQYNGVNYMLLMPEENARNLPSNAQLVANGEVTDPERVARAYESGARGQQGQTFIGALDQAPPEVQAVFRSESDQAKIDQGNQGMRTEQVQQNQQAIEDMGFGPIAPTTQVPVTNLQGQTPEQVQQDQQAFDQMTQTVRPGEEGWQMRNVIAETPALTTEQLRATDETKAALLEQQGIFEIPADKMVVQYESGRMSVVPQNDVPPPNATIITYGGNTPSPGKRGGQGLMSAIGDVLGVLEIPQRELQSLVADAALFYAENTGESGGNFLSGALMQSPGGGGGLAGFTQWIIENEEAARNAQQNGYTAPDGQVFEGNRAMWELYQADRNVVERAIDTTISDPLNVLPSMGAPLRGAATQVNNARRGIGYTDEVVDIVNAADTAVAPVTRRTAQEVVTTPATAIDDTAITAAEQAARNNPITGQGIIPEVVDVVPGQAVTPVVANTARSGQVMDAVLGTTENILNVAADILDIPENALGALVDRGIITIRGLVDAIGNIPAPDGRTIGDLWSRTTDQSVIRNTEEEISTVFDDTMGMQRREPTVPPAAVADTAPPPVAPRAPEFPTTPISTREPVLPTERTGIGQQPLLATDRPIDDFGTPPAPVAAADAALPTDRPIDDLTPRTPEELAVQRDEQFLATPEGQRTQRIMERWDKQYPDMPFIKPQTGMQRIGGEGRLDEAFELRPMDAARELAADHPREYEMFVRDIDRRVKRFVEAERARKATNANDLSFTSARYPDRQSENGVGVRSAWEVINEADHLVNTELPIFNRHMGAIAEAPEYQWKRWGRAGESHTALDTISRNGGRYQEGMPLHEAVELAIYHPDDYIAVSALEDVTRRISQIGNDGREVAGTVRAQLRNTPLRDALSRSRNKERSIINLRRNYLDAIDANRSMQRSLPEPQQAVDVPTAPAVTDLTSDGSIGGQVADLTEAATAIDDIAMEARNVPLSLPYRATSQIDAIPMQGPRNASRNLSTRNTTRRVVVDRPRKLASGTTIGEDDLPKYNEILDLAEQEVRRFSFAGEGGEPTLRLYRATKNDIHDRIVRGESLRSADGATGGRSSGSTSHNRPYAGQWFTPDPKEADYYYGLLSEYSGEDVSSLVYVDIPAKNALDYHSVSELTPGQIREVGSMEPERQAKEWILPYDVIRRSSRVENPRTFLRDGVPEPIPTPAPGEIDDLVDDIPMQADDLVGGNPVPPSAIQRNKSFLDRIDQKTIEGDLRRLADYRANAQRNMETDPLTRRERREQSRREYLASRAEGRAEAMRNTSTPMSRLDLESFYVRGRPVSASQAEVFGRKFSDGESLAARWDRYTLEELDKLGPDADLSMAEGLAASRTINDYVVEIMPDDIRARYEGFLKKARSQKIEGDDGQMVNRSELMAQNHALEQIRRQPRTGNMAGWWRKYDRVMTAIRQTFLYNWLTGPRYITTQMVGNSTTAALTGHSDILGEIMSPQAIREAWRASKNEGVLARSVMDEASEGYGLAGRRNITRGDSSVRDQTIEQAVTEANKYSLLGRYTRPIADRQIRDMAAAFDRLPREAMWASIMDTNLSVARSTLRERMLATLPDGASYAQARKLFDDLPQRFSSDDFRDMFADFDATWVDRNARDWQEAITKTDKAAKAGVKRTFFDGTEKNIDTHLKRVLFFHYWMSRATPLYTEAIARDPVYLYNFVKLQEAIRSDDGDGSGASLMKFFSTPMGYNILIRPDAMLATFAVMWEDSGFDPDGESRLGKWLRHSPIMVNPLVQAGLNLTGYMGDTFGPDPLGANKFIQLVQAGYDNVNAQLGLGLPPLGNIQETTMRQIRDFVSSYTGDFLPGAEHVEFTDPMAYKDNEVRSIVAEIALERGMNLEDPIVQDSMANPESELYQEAMKRYALQDAMDIGLRIIPVTAVLYPKSQLASPKERSADISQEQQQAERMGIGMTPRGDELYNDRDIIAASTEYSRTMQGLQDEYSAIGSPEEQAAYRFYNGIRYGDTDATIVVGGRSYNPDQIQSLYASDPAQAESLADQWAEETGNTDRVASMSEQRKAFRDEHPEYQEFVSWSGQLRDYEGGPQGWWQDVAQGNPNAARWFNSLTDDQKQNDMILTSMDGYFAYRGDQLAYWDQTPIETNGPVPPEPYNPIGSTDSGTGSGSSSDRTYGPTKDAIDEQIVEYQAEMEAYNEIVRTVLNQPPGFRLDLVNPMARQGIESNLRQAGIEPPRMGGYLYDYLQWAEANQGGDTSVNAYLRWYETQNPPAVEEKPAA